MQGRLRYALIAALLLTTFACTLDSRSTEERAAQVATEYFAKLAGGQADFGYSLIHPVNQATWHSYDEYARVVSGIDWTRFSATVAETRYCDDSLCFVCVNVPGGLESVPSFLRAPDNRANSGIIIYEAGPDECGNGEVSVFFARVPGEGSGIKISNHP